MICEKCGESITEGFYYHHQRLDVNFHDKCYRAHNAQAKGEDISYHTMIVRKVEPDKP